MRPLRIGVLGIKCPICGKIDWCAISDDYSFVLCARIKGEYGKYGNWGWVHPITSKIKVGKPFCIRILTPSKKLIHWKALWGLYYDNMPEKTDVELQLGVGSNGESLIFPMFDEHRTVIGLQRRYEGGRKDCITGSKAGVFWPLYNTFAGPFILITEGVSDCIAALKLGYEALGRYNCNSPDDIILGILQRYKLPIPVIIADNDKAGIEGAKVLARKILDIKRPVAIIIPPCKDLKEWVKIASRQEIVAQIKEGILNGISNSHQSVAMVVGGEDKKGELQVSAST